jgi:hypothetical protein
VRTEEPNFRRIVRDRRRALYSQRLGYAVDVEMVWHQRANRDTGLQWLTQELVSSVGDFT